MTRVAKIDQPETLDQAQLFTTNKNLFLRLGFCHLCAAQAAYGRQLGWKKVSPPCTKCVTSVDEIAMKSVGAPWRRLFEDQGCWGRTNVATSALAGATTLGSAQAGTDGTTLHVSGRAA